MPEIIAFRLPPFLSTFGSHLVYLQKFTLRKQIRSNFRSTYVQELSGFCLFVCLFLLFLGQAWSSPSQRAERAVENREEWRKLVVKSYVVPQRPSGLRDWWGEVIFFLASAILLCSRCHWNPRSSYRLGTDTDIKCALGLSTTIKLGRKKSNKQTNKRKTYFMRLTGFPKNTYDFFFKWGGGGSRERQIKSGNNLRQ